MWSVCKDGKDIGPPEQDDGIEDQDHDGGDDGVVTAGSVAGRQQWQLCRYDRQYPSVHWYRLVQS